MRRIFLSDFRSLCHFSMSIAALFNIVEFCSVKVSGIIEGDCLLQPFEGSLDRVRSCHWLRHSSRAWFLNEYDGETS